MTSETDNCALQVEKVAEEPQTPNLNVKVSVSFPQSEIFGIKLVNGHATEARLSIANGEPTPVGVSIVGGSLSLEQAGESRIIRNLTAQKYLHHRPAPPGPASAARGRAEGQQERLLQRPCLQRDRYCRGGGYQLL
jgi:hypothetical protein